MSLKPRNFLHTLCQLDFDPLNSEIWRRGSWGPQGLSLSENYSNWPSSAGCVCGPPFGPFPFSPCCLWKAESISLLGTPPGLCWPSVFLGQGLKFKISRPKRKIIPDLRGDLTRTCKGVIIHLSRASASSTWAEQNNCLLPIPLLWI